MPTKKICTTPKMTIEVDPALADLDITEAIEWLNRRIAGYDHTNIDYFRIIPTNSRYGWMDHGPPERTAPRARTFKSGHKTTSFLPVTVPAFPVQIELATGTIRHACGSWSYEFTDETLADANEFAVYRFGCAAWAWLRRTDQESGRLTNNGRRRNGVAWLRDYRDRVRPGMGRRAAIIATRKKKTARAAAEATMR